MKHRSYCFTINNYTNLDIAYVVCLDEYPIKYMIAGFEVGEEGTPHIQGYVQYVNPRSFQSVSRSLPRANLRVADGDAHSNFIYCSKDKEYYEVGKCPPKAGHRTDLDAVRETLDNGTIEDFADQHFGAFLRYGRMAKEYKFMKMKHRTEPPKVTWVYGPTGSGKTSFACSDTKSFYIKDGTQWWDGYEQQETIVIDDFDGEWPFRDLLRLLDRYPYQGQIKGGYVKINSKNIIITCDRSPAEVYDHIDGNLRAQILRRIHTVYKK